MQVIRQRCENRGVAQQNIISEQKMVADNRHTPVQQSIHATPQPEAESRGSRRRSSKQQSQQVNRNTQQEEKKSVCQTQDGNREKKVPTIVRKQVKEKEPEKKPESVYERIFNCMKQIRDAAPIPSVSAEAWAVFDTDTGQLLHGKLLNHKRECASLTKMMTFLTAWSIFTQNFPELTTVSIKVPKYCAGINGTSAFLRAKDTLTMHQLFYAMLLPSGNDAALVLADFFGNVLMSKEGVGAPPKSFAFDENLPVRHFLKEMNIIAKKIGMNLSVFDSPHGLANSVNVSTANEQAILAYHCMQNSVFCEVVKTPFYNVETEMAEYEW